MGEKTNEGTNSFTPAALAAFATTSWALKPGSSVMDLTSLQLNPESSPTVLMTTSTPRRARKRVSCVSAVPYRIGYTVTRRLESTTVGQGDGLVKTRMSRDLCRGCW